MTASTETLEEAMLDALRKAYPMTKWPDAPDPVDDATEIIAILDAKGWKLERKVKYMYWEYPED